MSRKKLSCIMLVDDNPNDNFYHERVIRRCDAAETVIAKHSGLDALEFLKSEANSGGQHPDLIFLDINMPGMNGWEFLEVYNQLETRLKSRAIVVMLTTSASPDDRTKAKVMNLASDFRTKPLTREMLEEVLDAYF
jgi:CheY-like chemotaxis protein